MREQQNAHRIEPMDIQIGVTIVLCFLLCHAANIVGIPIEALGVTTGAIMCVQDSTKAAYKTSLTRILGVVFGGVFGVAITLIDNALAMPYVFYLLCGLGVIVNLVVCKLFKMIYVQARVSCLTLLLVVLVSQGADRLTYAVNRFIGSLVGALIALIVTIVCARIVNQKNKNHT